MKWNNQFFLQHPSFFPLERIIPSLIKFKDHWPTPANYNEILEQQVNYPLYSCAGKILHFVDQESTGKEFENSYEPAIYLRGTVPTRPENWHDFFNFCIWTTFPKTKAFLNFLQYTHLLHRRKENIVKRTLVENVGAQFDETGVIVVSTDPSLLNLLVDFKWLELFFDNKLNVHKHLKLFIFGHGLYEKCLNPYIGLTAKGICFQVEPDFFSEHLDLQLNRLDELALNYLQTLNVKSVREALKPVPILGYPGWHPAQSKEFYLDKTYFRLQNFEKTW